MAGTAPFRQEPFASLPEAPRRPHAFLSLPARHVSVDTSDFGRVRIQLRELGEGPPLLLIHGLMTTGYSFRYVVSLLAERHRVLVPDLIGCGGSDKPEAHYGAREVARSIGALIDALDIRGCDVVGNSLGGYLCMWLALDDPAAMRSLTNIHSPGTPLWRLHALHAAMRAPGAHALLSWLIRRDPLRWAHKNVHYWDESLKSLEEARQYALEDEASRRGFAHYLADTLAPRTMKRFMAALAERERFPVPLRMIYARRDPMVPPSVGHRLAALVPDAEMMWLDECSHFAHVDQPDALAEAISEWAREHRQTDAASA